MMTFKEPDVKLQSLTRSHLKARAALPLYGLSASIKEFIATRGLSWTAGMAWRREMKAKNDADVVACLREAGAIPFIASNGPEGGLWLRVTTLFMVPRVTPGLGTEPLGVPAAERAHSSLQPVQASASAQMSGAPSESRQPFAAFSAINPLHSLSRPTVTTLRRLANSPSTSAWGQ